MKICIALHIAGLIFGLALNLKKPFNPEKSLIQENLELDYPTQVPENPCNCILDDDY